MARRASDWRGIANRVIGWWMALWMLLPMQFKWLQLDGVNFTQQELAERAAGLAVLGVNWHSAAKAEY